MSLRVASVEALTPWLGGAGRRHVLLRDVDAIAAGGPVRDLDLLVDDATAAAIGTALPRRRGGVKVDVYGVGRADYHGFPHLPEALGRRLLDEAAPVGRGLMAPSPQGRLLALAYHAVYHKAEQSGLHWNDASRNRPTPMLRELAALAAAVQPSLAMTHEALHDWLVGQGHGVTPERLAAYLRHDFRHGRKVYAHAALLAREPGEMNLFVLRGVALRQRRADDLIARLREQYEVLRIKPIPLVTRWREARHMRGGKWRRGGRPHVAVVVWDADPQPSSAAEREVHPFVFNRRQFAKQAWRQWFTEATGARPTDNPIHSTDNEAEAVGHLPLFFDAAEQAALLAEVGARRAALAAGSTP